MNGCEGVLILVCECSHYKNKYSFKVFAKVMPNEADIVKYECLKVKIYK